MPDQAKWTRLGLIAGGGDLPVEIAHAMAGMNPFIVRVKGFGTDPFEGFESVEKSIGQIGGILKALKNAGCDALCFAGYVKRPDIKDLQMDARGLVLVPKALAAGRKGDDAILRVVIDEFEQAGLTVIGANDVLKSLAPAAGQLTVTAPNENDRADIAKALLTARHMGELDIGQAAVVAHGVVLAVEAQEGTNGMLDRITDLPAHLRGAPDKRLGVLAKTPKPIQERRIDLPTIGLETVTRCDRAGLAGIALEAGSALIVNREAVIAALDAAGMFLVVEDAQP
ncbi:LpxI family protein [Maricaulis sp.]|uniref:LpxI family protein n=1 Tax=Maricaulis sp. TaxID=1486257 RepID=UPI003A8F70C7